MEEKVTIIIGAGSSLSDAVNKPIIKQPPLDRGFFKALKARSYISNSDYKKVIAYLNKHYSIDPLDEHEDSLERVMAMLYADIHGGPHKNEAAQAFRSLIRILNKSISTSTNDLNPGNKGNFYSLLTKLLSNRVKPENITVVTFNYDIQVEKALYKLETTAKWAKCGTIFSFPHCYHLPKYSRSSPTDNSISVFPEGDADLLGVSVLKLHGSLNWFSKHTSKDPQPSALLNPNRELNVTYRQEPITDIRYKGARTQYTYPIIVPPVINKAAILHR